MKPQVLCDGCGAETPLLDVKHASDEGNICHYCAECMSQYESLKAACMAEAARMEALLKLFIQDARGKSPLRLIPQDFPKREIPLFRLG